MDLLDCAKEGEGEKEPFYVINEQLQPLTAVGLYHCKPAEKEKLLKKSAKTSSNKSKSRGKGGKGKDPSG
jgi:hypothetical protein